MKPDIYELNAVRSSMTTWGLFLVTP